MPVLLIFLISLPTLSFACAGFYYGTYYIERSFNILHKNLVGNEFRRVTNSQYISFYNDKSYKQSETTKKINIDEWAKYLNQSKEYVDKVIYQGESDPSLTAEMQDYLSFIRQAEPLVNTDLSWNKSEKEIALESTVLEKEAEARLQQNIPDFLKLRYLFGAMRLAHYSQQFDVEKTLYDSYYPKLAKVDSEVQFWIASLLAGMHKQQGKAALAAYEFAQLFKQSPTKRYTAYVNFSVNSDADWQALMSMCKDENEQALMYFIRALKPKANSLQELKRIYELAPNSVWLDALLSRELEYVQFAKQIKESRPGSWYDYSLDINKQLLISDTDEFSTAETQKLTEQKIKRRNDYIDELKQIVQKIRTEGKHKDLFLADFAEVYLRLLSQKPTNLQDVGQLQIKYKDDPRLAYLDSLKLFVYLETISTINPTIESEISTYLKRIQKQADEELTFDDIIAYTYIKLEPLYQQKASPFKHYISKVRGVFNPDNITVAEIKDLQKLISKPETNFLEKQMLINNNYDDFTQNNNLDEIIIKRYLAEGKFNEANKLAAPLNSKITTRYNPFNNVLSGNNRDKAKQLSLKTVTETLFKINHSIEKNPQDANSHYLLANAFYNMSWFGNSPNLTRYHRSTSNWEYGNINFDKAKEHYQLAYQYADNDELKTKALYGLAKIEFNEKYMEEDKENPIYSEYEFEGGQIKASVAKLRARNFGKYFKQLQQYKNTNYFKDVIEQCAIYKSHESW